jgi:glycolate oxidase
MIGIQSSLFSRGKFAGCKDRPRFDLRSTVASVEKLRQLVSHETRIIDDPAITAGYAHDAAEIAEFGAPWVVALPKSIEDISKIMQLATEENIPVVPRGAGSGLSGGANAIENCIVLSLEKMNQIIEIDPINQVAIVEAGVINLDLDKRAREFDLAYLPDPASREWSTIGGNVATNAGGMCCVKYGVTANHVREIKVVLSDGSILTLGSKTKKGVTQLDLLHLMIGSEGTLGIIAEITVALAPRAKEINTLIATFSSIDSAASSLPSLIRLNPSMLEIMDKSTIEAVEAWRPLGFENIGSVVIFQSDTSIESTTAAEEIVREFGAIDTVISDNPDEVSDLIQVRKLAFPALERLGVALLDDVCVPISRISDLVHGVTQIATEFDLQIGIFGHGGDGNLHPTIVYPRSDAPAKERALAAFHAILELSYSLGGTATGEHGVGSIKVNAAARESGDKAINLQRQIKSIFDPKGILNPGKKIP